MRSLDDRLREALGIEVCEAMTDGEWNQLLTIALKAEARSQGRSHIFLDRLQRTPVSSAPTV